MPGTALWVDAFVCLPGFTCLPLSPFICLPLSPSLDDPVWVDGFICLPLSFVSRCLPAWMPGTALWVDGFICLPLSPFICLSGWTGSCVSLCLPLFVSRSLPAWMPGTALWVDGFICLPLSPSLDVWHSRSAVSFTSRGSVLLAGSGLPSALALASVIPCLVDVGDRVLICLPFIWTSISLGLVVGRLPCLSLATPCLFVQCLVISCGPELTIAVRCGARLQLC